MRSWLKTLNTGLSRRIPVDRITGTDCPSGIKGNLKRLWPYVKIHRRHGLLGLLIVCASTCLAFPPPLITRYIVDDIVLGHQLRLLAGALLLLIGCLIFEKLTRLFEDYHFARFEQRITFDIQQDLIDRVLELPKPFFDDKQTGYLQSRLVGDMDCIRWLFSNAAVQAISNLLKFAGGIGFLFYLEWRLSVIILVLIPGLIGVMRFFGGKIHRLSHQVMEHRAEISGHVEESLAALPLIQANSKEGSTRNRLMALFGNFFHVSLEQHVIISLATICINAIPALARVVTLGAGAIWIINDQWTIGSLVAYQAYLAYVFGPAQFLASTNLQFQKALAALERVASFFDTVPQNNVKSGFRVESLAGELEFRDVCFGYHAHEQVLTDISFHIRSGERVALTGPSGIGKTTVISLILQFYRLNAGAIYFDGQLATDFNTASLRRRIGYASQNPQFLSTSVLENLRFGAPEANRDKIIRAARTAAIHDFIDTLPQKYDTIIGANGPDLSEGQKQRLSIARAMVKDPDILILDEPTAALDHMTEKSIFDLLPSHLNRTTVLLVSHRLSTLARADRILWLNGGGITEISTDLKVRDAIHANEPLTGNENAVNLFQGFRC